MSALNAPTIQKMINAFQSGENERKGLAPKTVKNIHGVLHKALQQAVELGFIRVNPADACKLPRITKKEIKPLDKEQISDFLDAIHRHEFETLYLFTLFTGARQSECIGLRWRCVDFEKGTIMINAQLLRDYANGGYYFDETTKNNKVRQITPAKFIMTALKKHRVEQMKARMLVGAAWAESDYVFTNELGEHLKHVTVYKGYKRIVKELGIPDARYHDLRHSYAVAALRAGDDVKTVQENLGHHTAAFTLDQYGHVTEAMKKESAARMDMYIRGIKKG
ncbi:MAG: site-specific integrase [Defluviitaleaceae bacterium]|nr:site-specific integrase [Defluviitaleaceae bacterium]